MGIFCMAQKTQTGTLYQPRGVGWGGRWEWGWEGGDICIPMTESCWGLTENNKILQSNYPSIKKINKILKTAFTTQNKQPKNPENLDLKKVTYFPGLKASKYRVEQVLNSDDNLISNLRS